MALKYLKDTEANINNILIMMNNFNIRESSWNPLFSNHSIHSNMLTYIADFLSLCIFSTTIQVPTRYADNPNDLDSVINLMFLQPNSDEFNSHIIHPEWRLLLDHALLIVKIWIFEENIQTGKRTTVKDSEEEFKFITDISDLIKRLNTNHISNKKDLE